MTNPMYQPIAKHAHEANRAYCAWLGDHSQAPWDLCPQWQKDSAIAGVEFLATNPQAGPGDSHASWLKQKREEGWTYGPVKDADAKTHPCFVPYEQLPESQRIKDYIFVFTVRAALA